MDPEAIEPSATPAAHDLRVRGQVVLYRLHDLGYEVDLERAGRLLGDPRPERARPARGEAQAIEIPTLPLTVPLGERPVTIAGAACPVDFSARVFDFGVGSFRARVRTPGPMAWSEFLPWATACAGAGAWPQLMAEERDGLARRIAGAITRPAEGPVSEDYVVFRIDALSDVSGAPVRPNVLAQPDIARLLLGETQAPSESAQRDLLSPRFTYFDHDLAVLTWSSALVVEPQVDNADVEYVLEFANAQLLELRYYDSLLDHELPRMYDRIERARGGFHLLGRGYSRVLGDLQTRVAEITELVERSENALKMTDDVFLARIYSAALEIFGARIWRRGIDRKLEIIRDSYAMLNAESQARRSEALELVIVLLIVIELVVALRRG